MNKHNKKMINPNEETTVNITLKVENSGLINLEKK